METKALSNINITQNTDGQLVVSSRQVAEHFEKEHKNVLNNIREIFAAEKSAAKFFIESAYENRGKQYPEYLMNRDGFTLLAMSFTGKKALEWKIKYIEAFNAMEKALKKTNSSDRKQERQKSVSNKRYALNFSQNTY